MAGSRTWMPTVGGVLILIAGIFGVIRGLAQMFGGLFAGSFLRFIGLELGGWISIIVGVIVIIAGFVAMQRKAWWLALIGAILASIHFWLLGILAIIFIALSRREFA